jgi:hypothetical protein
MCHNYIIKLPGTVNVATLQLPTVVTVFVPGETLNLEVPGALITTIPDPPDPPIPDAFPPAPPPPPPVLAPADAPGFPLGTPPFPAPPKE